MWDGTRRYHQAVMANRTAAAPTHASKAMSRECYQFSESVWRKRSVRNRKVRNGNEISSFHPQ
ncbi:hypothetical protein I7I48_05053 [Histoplasma ohiense]|nr:hypothetical protein I7I48_05053 [Histoplasma ohiense (nom. inval.)]